MTFDYLTGVNMQSTSLCGCTVLNEEKFIRRCIESLLTQTMPIQILVLDGGSTDSTLEVLSDFGDSISVFTILESVYQMLEI